MTPLLRQIAYLVVSVVVFLVVLGAFLWGSLAATAEHIRRSSDLFAPSMAHIARAQRTLTALQSELYRHRPADAATEKIPYRFDVLAALENLDRHLTATARLAHAFGYRNAFDLPDRALEQVDSARESVLAPGRLGPAELARILALLGSLDGVLQQLERIYELELQAAIDEHERLASSSLYTIALGVLLLVAVATPLIARLAFGVRDTVRREARNRRELEEAARSLEIVAMYDSLTRLGNRHLFRARLDQLVESAMRTNRTSALLYINLDDFKRINDSMGHDAGDEVLKVVGARLAETVRSADTVARVGGDEFTVILSDLASRESAGTIAAKLLSRMQEPMYVRGHEVVVSGSIGITIVPTDAADPAVLMKNADMALYRAKERGRNRFQFFVEAMNRAMSEQMAMEAALRTAIREGGLALAYQPQVSFATGEVTCLEALLRWPRADGPPVSPEEFIPVAEATGQMKNVGSWVLARACRDLAHLRADGAPALRVSINLSAREFREADLVVRIARALEANGLPPSAMEVEITETTLIDDIEVTSKVLGDLRALGISIAIDDFGIGYSSLNYLKHLPIDALKIDRSFVRDIETDEADRSIVDAIVAMANSLSLRTVAEGIETAWQLEYLALKGCGEGQGFLLSHPVPLGELALAEVERKWSPVLAAGNRLGLQLAE